MSSKLGLIRNPQNTDTATTGATQDFDVAFERLQQRRDAHAATTQHTLQVLQVLELGQHLIDPKVSARIKRAALDAFALEGLSLADAADAVDAAAAAVADE